MKLPNNMKASRLLLQQMRQQGHTNTAYYRHLKQTLEIAQKYSKS